MTLKTSLLCSALIGLGLLSTGCASTATGIERSALRSGPDVQLRQEAPRGSALAIVRYPAFVDPDAEDAFARAYADTVIGQGSAGDDPIETSALADGLILKSNFYAMSLYRELAARLPEHSVLLSPHEIRLGDDGRLTSVPMTQAEDLPTVVSVDFTAYTFPNVKTMMSKRPLSFGDLVTPLVTVRTDPRTSVGTEGVLMASSPLIDAASGEGRGQAIDDATIVQRGEIDATIPELDFVSHISGLPRMSPPRTPVSRPRSGTVKSYPIERLKLNESAIQTLSADSPDILEQPFTDAFVNEVIAIINGTDMRQATMFRRADAIADYDENLAALTLVGSDRADYQNRLRYAERLLEAEQKYLSVQSLRLYDGIINGEMGALVRDILKEEHRVLERRRRLAKQQNTATALAILSAVAAGATIAKSDDDGRVSTGEQIATNLLVQGAIFSATEAYRRNRMSREVGSNYVQSVLPALDTTVEVQVDLIDSNETITAIRFEDLKSKLSELYAENQRSLDVIATQCTYRAPNQPGTWLGACENGLAHGSGVGVFRDDRGNLVEHYGYAVGGLADGPGYRILRLPDQSISYEGNFADGKANGVIRVDGGGRAPILRLYRDGQDIGAANPNAPIASPFEGSPPVTSLAG